MTTRITRQIKKWAHENPKWPEYGYDSNDSRIIEATQSIGRSIDTWMMIKSSVEDLKVLLDFGNVADNLFVIESVIKSSNIENEWPDRDEIRRTLQRRVTNPGNQHVGNWDGMVDMVLDASRNSKQNLTADRMFAWHAGMFPEGKSDGRIIDDIGCWRKGPAIVASVKPGTDEIDEVFYEAPEPAQLDGLMDDFLAWIENTRNPEFLCPYAAVALAHLRFEQIHPFADGNGRIGRAICDLMLARIGIDYIEPFHCLSARIEREKRKYEIQFETMAVAGNLDATDWVAWFLGVLDQSINEDAVAFQRTMHEKIAHMIWMRRQVKHADSIKVLGHMVRWDQREINNAEFCAISGAVNQTASRQLGEMRRKGLFEYANPNVTAGSGVAYRLVEWSAIKRRHEGSGNEARNSIEAVLPKSEGSDGKNVVPWYEIDDPNYA